MPANGLMLRLARQRKQLSQIDAATKLGIEQSLLSRIENGIVEAREEVLARASDLYEVPEILVTRIETGNPAYLDWLQQELSP